LEASGLLQLAMRSSRHSAQTDSNWKHSDIVPYNILQLLFDSFGFHFQECWVAFLLHFLQGKAIVIFANGDKYVGALQNAQKEGDGMCIRPGSEISLDMF
jgi:hypothetical protein